MVANCQYSDIPATKVVDSGRKAVFYILLLEILVNTSGVQRIDSLHYNRIEYLVVRSSVFIDLSTIQRKNQLQARFRTRSRVGLMAKKILPFDEFESTIRIHFIVKKKR